MRLKRFLLVWSAVDRVRLSFFCCLTVDKIWRSGGFALLWSDDINVSIFSYSSSHIDAMVIDNSGQIWRFTGFYENLSTSLRNEF